MRRSFIKIFVVLLLSLAALWWFSFRHAMPNPEAVAAAETRMWQAYYAADPLRLHGELTGLLQAQFHLRGAEANTVAQSLALAAWKFENISEGYEAVVLPDLEQAYRQLGQALHRPFNPREAAKAELAWWIARRTPGQDSAQQVGQKIGELYAVIYGAPRPGFTEAGILRAEAGKLRDKEGANCDWKQVEALLQRSYHTLAKAI
jgi:hypothetical protein